MYILEYWLVTSRLDFLDTSPEQLARAGHQGSFKCRCSEFIRLKIIKKTNGLQNWHICYGRNGLSTRGEVKARSRGINFSIF